MCTAETFVDLYYMSNKRRCKEASAKTKKMFVLFFFCLFCFVFLMGLFSSNIPLIMMNMVLKMQHEFCKMLYKTQMQRKGSGVTKANACIVVLILIKYYYYVAV